MRYITFDAPGGPDVLRLTEGATPTPGPAEVLVQVVAAGVNRPDILQRQGRYPPPPGASPILGLEVAGTVTACGSAVTRWRAGDEVCALVSGGGYADACVAPAEQCLLRPTGVSLVEAAAMPETFFTVWTNLFQRGHLESGETVLIHGGSSGIGTTAIQLAHLRGARVLATAGTQTKCEACRRLGADVAINYREEDFVSVARDVTGGRGVDVVLDMVGGSYFARNLTALATEGRLVQIAFMTGSRVEADLQVMMTKRLTLTGSTLRPRTVAQKGAIARELEQHVWPDVARRSVHPVVHRTFPLADAAGAHRLLEEGSVIGKLVLTT